MEYVTVGKVRASHGLKGELLIILFSGEAPWIKELKTFRLLNEATKKPLAFTVATARPNRMGLIVKTKEFVNRNDSDLVIGYLFQIPESMTVSRKGEKIFLREIQGFVVFDQTLGELGPVKTFATNGAQDLLVVDFQGAERQIPMVKEFLIEIDWPNKKIRMNLPVGIFDQ